MSDIQAIIFFSLCVLLIVITQTIFYLKIKYLKLYNQKEFQGISHLNFPFHKEWWIAALTLAFPIFGKDEIAELNAIRKKVNQGLYIFYLIMIMQIILVGILIKID
jgi:hypothetical protein